MENKIMVGPTHIEISDYNMGDYRSLEYKFEVTDPFYNKYPLGMYYDEENRKLYVSRNVDIPAIEYKFNRNAHYDINPNPSKKINVKLLCAPRDEEQKTALRFMIGNSEFKDTRNRSQLGLYLNTGKGKTYSAIATSTFYSLKSIIITSSSSWLKQWRDEIVNFTDTKYNEILLIDSSAKIKYLLDPSKSEKYKYFLITHSLIQGYCSDNGWDKLNDLFIALGIGIKFIDEAHMNFNNICMIDFFTNVWKTYYITATPTKSSDSEKIVYANYFKNMQCINLFNPDVDPHTDYYALIFNSKIQPWVASEMKTAYGLNRIRYVDWLVCNEEFHKVLHIVIQMTKKRGKSLYYIATNASIEIVKGWIESNYPEYIGNIGVFTSVTPANKKRFELDKEIILSTTKSFGAAVDCKGLKMTVNLAEPFKSEVLARQTLGRTRDNDTLYLDIVDVDMRDTKRYYYDKLPIFRKYALSVNEIVVSTKELDTKYNQIIEHNCKNRYQEHEYFVWINEEYDYKQEEYVWINPTLPSSEEIVKIIE